MRPDLWGTTPLNPTTITNYLISGITSSQSAEAVTVCLASVPGIRSVSVDLASKRVTVQSTHPLERITIVAVIAEMGYDISEFPST